jgi:plastocyanin
MRRSIQKKASVNLLLSMLFYFSVLSYSQTLHIIQATSNRTFVPSDITISVGDTVRWVNTGGLHDVVADDGSFTSGSPSSSLWVFDHIFNTLGNKRYFCSTHGSAGGIGMSGIVRVINPTGILDSELNLRKFLLNQNYPNPFNPVTRINWQTPVSSRQTLKVYDVLGNEIVTLLNEDKAAGNYTVDFSASDLPSGVYFYKIQSGNFIDTKKMLLLR